jgi:hypothetical protein
MNKEILKGLSIEELEERAEFTVTPTAELSSFSEAEIADMEADYAAGNYWQRGCKCNC